MNIARQAPPPAANRLPLGGMVGLTLAAGLLSACAIPLPLTIASYAADGVSAMATGKTLSDHALSAATGEDCALWRVFDEREICMEVEERMWGTVDPAVLATVPPGPEHRIDITVADGRTAALPNDAPVTAVAALTGSDPVPPVAPADGAPMPLTPFAVVAEAGPPPAFDPPLAPRRPQAVAAAGRVAGPTALLTEPVPRPPALPWQRTASAQRTALPAWLDQVPLPPTRPAGHHTTQVADAGR